MSDRPYGRTGGSLGLVGCGVAFAIFSIGATAAVLMLVSRRAEAVVEAATPMPSPSPLAPPVSAVPAPMPTPAVALQPGTIGLGNVGTIGGATEETAVADPAPTPEAPLITPGAAEVRGSLDREVILRVVRAHISEVQGCYERALGTDPSLAGRVTVSFVVGPTGAVQVASIASSTLTSSTDADESTAECIVSSVRTWLFPTPDGGGVVAINYPFVFSSSP